MTPDQRADLLVQNAYHAGCAHSSIDSLADCAKCLTPFVADSIRAALRERDARLLKLAAEWDEHAESVGNEEPHTAQDFTRCAKDLRALLEEAGKRRVR